MTSETISATGSSEVACVKVWDSPTRLFHIVMAIGFVAAMVTAIVSEDSSAFPLHMLIGLVVGFSLLLRVIWLAIGSRHARAGAFAFSPGSVISYLRGVLTRTGEASPARNPASAYAAIVMCALLAVIVLTGVMMSRRIEAAEELHTIAAWTLVAVAAVHVLGVLIHHFRFHDGLPLSMLTGRKLAPAVVAIRSTRPFEGVLFALLVGLFAVMIYRNYEPAVPRTTLPLIGTPVALGESEADHAARKAARAGRPHQDD